MCDSLICTKIAARSRFQFAHIFQFEVTLGPRRILIGRLYSTAEQHKVGLGFPYHISLDSHLLTYND